MIVPPQITRRYNEFRPVVERHSESIKQTFHKYCDDNNYAFISRIKSLESLAEKIETGRYSDWSSIEDYFACSVIIPNLSYEENVIKFVENIYPSDKIIYRRTKLKSPEVFRFDTTRYFSHILVEDNIRINFELQIRTALEHAWITTTHDLVYKHQKIDWRRLRLASELKANLELLDNIILSFEQNVYLRTENSWPEITSKLKIQEYILDCFEKGLIPDEFLPDDNTRFVNNIFEIMKQFPNYNYKNLESLTKEFITSLNTCILATPTELFPRSLSLYQFVLGVLLQKSYLRANDIKIKIFVSNEFEQFYPIAKSLNYKFKID